MHRTSGRRLAADPGQDALMVWHDPSTEHLVGATSVAQPETGFTTGGGGSGCRARSCELPRWRFGIAGDGDACRRGPIGGSCDLRDGGGYVLASVFCLADGFCRARAKGSARGETPADRRTAAFQVPEASSLTCRRGRADYLRLPKLHRREVPFGPSDREAVRSGHLSGRWQYRRRPPHSGELLTHCRSSWSLVPAKAAALGACLAIFRSRFAPK